ncbi:alpha/beta hydrolase [Blastomonas sp.]|uniref:alpha/beta hydrolase n=1 Tax=Blastomonas sp. TaxID=1909299 RepID=UPI0035931A89
MRLKMLGLVVAAGMIAPVLAQQAGGQERLLDRECRREVVRLCGMDRSKIRNCLQERRSELSAGCKQQLVQGIAKRRGAGAAPKAGTNVTTTPARPIAYGSNAAQVVDLYLPQSTAPGTGFPLVVYVHGGGWHNGDRSMVQHKPGFFMSKGWAFASVGYRLLPGAPVEQQARDVAAALRKLADEAQSLGIDPARILVMGHSAGAHLAALVATDPTYLQADMGRIAGVILLDGAGYDVARQMADQPMIARSIYTRAFGSDPVRQARLSPITHAAAPNAPRWLILHVARRTDAATQSNALASVLTAAGASAEVTSIDGETHMTINRELGVGDNPHTRAVSDFLSGF